MKSIDVGIAMCRTNTSDPWKTGKAFPGSKHQCLGTTEQCVQRPATSPSSSRMLTAQGERLPAIGDLPLRLVSPSPGLNVVITMGFGGSVLTMHGTPSFLHVGPCVCPFLFP